jgi:G:T/U-mismatch repair DNA glycosylase
MKRRRKQATPSPLFGGGGGGGRTLEKEHGGGGRRTGSFSPLYDEAVAPHTLILGTQPSVKSIGAGWYFGSDTNSFWHIVGEALESYQPGMGFRRGFHQNQSRPNGDVVPAIARFLTPNLPAVDYAEATRRLTAAGFAVWDFIESSVRKGSLDSDIKEEVTADIGGFVARHPSIERIVFATGMGSAVKFRKHFGEWLGRGAFRCGGASALDVFAKTVTCPALQGGIELVIPPSVSPAMATMTFGEKRDAWLDLVFKRSMSASPLVHPQQQKGTTTSKRKAPAAAATTATSKKRARR